MTKRLIKTLLRTNAGLILVSLTILITASVVTLVMGKGEMSFALQFGTSTFIIGVSLGSPRWDIWKNEVYPLMKGFFKKDTEKPHEHQ